MRAPERRGQLQMLLTSPAPTSSRTEHRTVRRRTTSNRARAMLRGAIAMAAPNVRATFQAGRGANPPLVVLVHGLESFSGTWDAVRARCASPDGPHRHRAPNILALDLRGHGLTPVGDEDDFSPAALAADVVACARAHMTAHGAGGKDTFTIVGHSMGSRVALRAAADFPDAVDHVVVEDMDCSIRRAPKFDHDALRRCVLTAPTREEVVANLAAAMPDVMTRERCEGYAARGRIVETSAGEWTSLVNPLGYALAYERVLAVDDAALAVKQIERFAAMRQPAPIVHLWRAPFDEPSTCAKKDGLGGVEWILQRDGSSEWRVRDCVFENAEHSVHNTRVEAFTDAMVALVMDGTDAPERL